MIDYQYGVALNRIKIEDLETIRNWRNDFNIWKWCRQCDLIDETQQAQWYEKQSKDPSISMYRIEIGQNRFVGVCGLTDIDLVNRRAEFSLYIAKEFQGQGMGKAALITLFAHGFRNLNLHIIWGESFEGNQAIPMFELLGMKKEGTRKDFYFKNGEYVDAHLYAVNRKSFEQHIAPIPRIPPPSEDDGNSPHT